jgi:hypothetical protein
MLPSEGPGDLEIVTVRHIGNYRHKTRGQVSVDGVRITRDRKERPRPEINLTWREVIELYTGLHMMWEAEKARRQSE